MAQNDSSEIPITKLKLFFNRELVFGALAAYLFHIPVYIHMYIITLSVLLRNISVASVGGITVTVAMYMPIVAYTSNQNTKPQP